MSNQEILYEVREGIATITLNRPDKLNAWTAGMEREVRAAMLEADADEGARVIILTGAGRGFCAGADMSLLSTVAAQGLRFDHAGPRAGLEGRGLDDEPHAREGHHERGAGGLHEAGQAVLVVLQALGSQRRVGGNGYRPDQLQREEQRHELDARGQHHQHPIARSHAPRDEPGGDGERFVGHLGVGVGGLLLGVVQEVEVGAIADAIGPVQQQGAEGVAVRAPIGVMGNGHAALS